MPIVSAFRRVLILVGFALSFVVARAESPFPPGNYQSSGGSIAADGFDPNPIDGNVIAMAVQDDGMILIAGTFTQLQPKGTTTPIVRPRIARLFPDGSVDTSFYININAQVNVMTVDKQGNILVGGRFTQVTGFKEDGVTMDTTQTRNHMALIKYSSTKGIWVVDNAFDPNFGAGTYNDVTSLAVQKDGKILVGGGFTTIQPNGTTLDTTASHLVRLNSDGTRDTAFTAKTNGYITSIVVQEATSQILIAGSFTVTNGDTATPHAYLARLNMATGTVDSTFNPILNSAVNVVTPQDDEKLLIGGSFTVVNSDSDHPRFARLNKDGTLDTSFVGTTDGGVGLIKIGLDGKIYLTGSFTTISGTTCSFAGRVYRDGSIDTSFVPSTNDVVYTMALEPNGSVLLGGVFSTLTGFGKTAVTRNHLARVTQLGALDTDLRPELNGRLLTVKAQKDGKLLVGGSFTSVAGATHRGIVRLNDDGTIDTTFTAQVEGTVEAILEQADGNLLVGGTFSEVNGEAHSNIVQLTPTGKLVTAFDVTLNGAVTALVQQSDTKLIIAGAFTSVIPHGTTDATTRSALVRLNTDGTLDKTWDPEPNSLVNTLVLQSDGKLLAGGSFTSVTPNGASASTSRYAMARFNTDGTVDRDFNPNVNGAVYAIAVQSDGKIVFGGSFRQLAPSTTAETRYNIGRLTSAGQIDTTFDPHADNIVESIVIQSDGSMLVGGYFTSFRPGYDLATTDDARTQISAVPVTYVAKLTSGGAVDSTFKVTLDTVAGNGVVALAATSKGNVLGGAFSSATSVTNGTTTTVPVGRLVRVDDKGAVDTSFSDLSGATGAAITAITTEQNGSLVVAGNFTDVSGTRASGLAAFYADGTPQTAFAPYIQSNGNTGKVLSIGELVNKGTPIATQRTGLARIDLQGNLDTTFAVNDQLVSGTFNALTTDKPNGKGNILLGGSIKLSSSSVAGMIRLKSDGGIDSSYTDLGLSSIYSIAVQDDGYILVGGSFTYAVTTTDSSGTSTTTNYVNLLRLKPDGTMDTTFKPNPDSTVQQIALLSDGTMIIGGAFTSIAPVGTSSSTTTTRHYLAKLGKDGTPDKNFDPKANSVVYALQVLSNGKILVGGNFTTFQPNGAGSTTTRNYFALLNADGTLDSTDFGVNGPVYAIAKQSDDSVLVGGGFSTILSQTRNNLARLTSAMALDTAFNPNPNGVVGSFAIQSDGQILIGGSFTALAPGGTALYDPKTATPRNHIARVTKAGALDPSFNPNFDGTVTHIMIYSENQDKEDKVVVTGSFSTIQPSGSLLIGGSFDTINSVAVKNLALFATDGSISSGFLPNPNGEVDAILPLIDDRLIIAGQFTALDGVLTQNAATPANYIARFEADNSYDATFVSKAPGPVYGLSRQSTGALIAGGALATDATKGWLARFKDDGSLDNTFAATVPGKVNAVIVQPNDYVVVLADVLTSNATATTTTSQILRFKADGTVDSDFNIVNPHTGETIKTIALQVDGKLVIGGSFTSVANGTAKNFARLNPNGTLDTTLTAAPDGAVTALAITTEGKIAIGGTFAKVDLLSRFGLARLAPSARTDFASSTFEVAKDRTYVTWTRKGVLPELLDVAVDVSTNGSSYLQQGTATRVATPVTGESSWTLTGVNLSSAGDIFFRTRSVVPGTPQASNGLINNTGYYYMTAVPIVTGPTSLNVAADSTFTYVITASNIPTKYHADNLPGTLSLDETTGVISGKLPASPAGQPYTITVWAENANGVGSKVNVVITSTASTGSPDDSPRLVNLSILGNWSPGHNVIVGFVIGGSNPMNVYTRAMGPSLYRVGLSASSVLKTSRLQLATVTGVVKADAQGWTPADSSKLDNVQQGLNLLDSRLGATPAISKEADTTAGLDYKNDTAYESSLNPGPYTITTIDPNGVGGSVLTEVYDASVVPVQSGAPRLMNLSARGHVDAAHYVVGGFVITGDASKKMRVLIRGVGQTLGNYGIPDAITDTTLTLFTVNQKQIASNDNWWDATTTTHDAGYTLPSVDVAATAKQVGAFPLIGSSKDAAIVIDLPPGVYTARVTGPSGSTGEAMVEVYEVPAAN